jgi:oxygen-independent coproporphyrinogen-3 oxidase
MTEPTQLTAAGRPLKENSEATLDRLPPLANDLDDSSGSGRVFQPPAAAYLHVPFCFHKCHYCDFYSIVDSQDRREPFTDRLIDELRVASPRFTEPLRAVFVGGGTPTLLLPDQWRRLLAAMAETLPGFPGAECTVEANPETVTAELLDVLATGGVNRISIGAQSFDPRHLATLERHHDPASVVRAVGLARASGIDRMSLDLIFGVPGQTLDDWRRDLDAVLALEPSHLSCYGLMYEPNTPLTKRRDLGRIEPIDPDVEAQMYETTCAVLAGAGLEHYEISNWARPGERCVHNLEYWHGSSWWAAGPSAVGQLRDADGLGGWRWRNVPRLGDWLATGPWPPVVDVERIDPETARAEAFMLGLRLLDGMSVARIDALLTGDPEAPRRRAAIEAELAAGRLERAGEVIRLTAAGLLVADSVVGELL